MFRFIGASYVSGTMKGIFLFGGQSTFNETASAFLIQDSTIFYVPKTIAKEGHSSGSKLSDGAIAGAVIGAIVGAILGGLLIIGLVGGFSYFHYYKKLDTPENEA